MHLMEIRVVELELRFLLCTWRCCIVERVYNGGICVFAHVTVFLLIPINCRLEVVLKSHLCC